MKFLVDECTGRSVLNWLKAEGYDAIFVKDICGGASDDWVLKKSCDDGRVLITCDKDFGDMVFRDQKKFVSIILLRLVDESISNKIHIVKWIIQNYYRELHGNFILASDKNIRIVSTNRA